MAHLLSARPLPCVVPRRWKFRRDTHISQIPFSSLSMVLLGIQLQQPEMGGSCCGLNVECLSPLPKAHTSERLAPSWWHPLPRKLVEPLGGRILMKKVGHWGGGGFEAL